MMHMLIKINSYKREMTIFKLNKKLKTYRSSPPEVLLRKGVLKICSKSTGQHPCGSAISSSKATLLKSLFGMGVFLVTHENVKK